MWNLKNYTNELIYKTNRPTDIENKLLLTKGEKGWGIKQEFGVKGGSVGKESTCNAGDLDSIPGSGRSPGEGNGNPLQSLAWKIPWTEESGGLQSMGLQRVRHD